MRSSRATITAGSSVFALAINASYTKRSAYDARSSALIRTTLNAITSDGLMDKLLPRAGEVPHAAMPETKRYAELADALKALVPAVTGAGTGGAAAGGATGAAGSGAAAGTGGAAAGGATP